MRNRFDFTNAVYLVDFLVNRSKDVPAIVADEKSGIEYPPLVMPGLDERGNGEGPRASVLKQIK